MVNCPGIHILPTTGVFSLLLLFSQAFSQGNYFPAKANREIQPRIKYLEKCFCQPLAKAKQYYEYIYSTVPTFNLLSSFKQN